MSDPAAWTNWPSAVGGIIVAAITIFGARTLGSDRGEKPKPATENSSLIGGLAETIAEMRGEIRELEEQLSDANTEMTRATENLRRANERAEFAETRAARAEAALVAAGLPIPPHD